MMRLSFLAATSLLALSLSSPRSCYVKAAVSAEASTCVAETSALYESGNATLLDAATNFSTYIESLCLSSEGSDSETTPCKMPNITNMLETLPTDGIKFEASLNFTATYSDPTFVAYKDACLNADGKLCYVDADTVISGTYYVPFEVSVDVHGYPLCSAKICSEEDIKDMVNEASAMAVDYYDFFTEFTLNITGLTCDVAETRDRALRGAVSHLMKVHFGKNFVA